MVPDDLKAIFNPAQPGPLEARLQACPALVNFLQETLGQYVTNPFKVSVNKQKTLRRLNEFMRARLQPINYINKCTKYHHLLHSHAKYQVDISPHRMQYILKAVMHSESPLVEPPSLHWQPQAALDVGSLESWIDQFKARRKELWKEFRGKEKRIKKELSEKFQTTLLAEQFKSSRKYRSMVYRKERVGLPITLINEADGRKMEITPAGLDSS
jgi:hypothetical protein